MRCSVDATKMNLPARVVAVTRDWSLYRLTAQLPFLHSNPSPTHPAMLVRERTNQINQRTTRLPIDP